MLIAHDTAVNNYSTETIFNTLFNTRRACVEVGYIVVNK